MKRTTLILLGSLILTLFSGCIEGLGETPELEEPPPEVTYPPKTSVHNPVEIKTIVDTISWIEIKYRNITRFHETTYEEVNIVYLKSGKILKIIENIANLDLEIGWEYEFTYEETYEKEIILYRALKEEYTRVYKGFGHDFRDYRNDIKIIGSDRRRQGFCYYLDTAEGAIVVLGKITTIEAERFRYIFHLERANYLICEIEEISYIPNLIYLTWKHTSYYEKYKYEIVKMESEGRMPTAYLIKEELLEESTYLGVSDSETITFVNREVEKEKTVLLNEITHTGYYIEFWAKEDAEFLETITYKGEYQVFFLSDACEYYYILLEESIHPDDIQLHSTKIIEFEVYVYKTISVDGFIAKVHLEKYFIIQSEIRGNKNE